MSIYFYAIQASGELVRHPIGDPEDATDWLRMKVGIPFSPNVGRLNEAHVLEALGLPISDCEDNYGDEDASAFLGRILMAEAVAPEDAGTPATSRRLGDGFGGPVPIITAGGRWHECGRSEGYLQRKLAELRELAEWAAKRGHRVAWA
jgi:hypothetical protein